MDKVIQAALDLLQASLWSRNIPTINTEDSEKVYTFLKKHAVVTLPTNIIKIISVSDDVKAKWEKQIAQQIYKYQNVLYAQKTVLSSLKDADIPVVVLKGTSASQYYPVPEYRMMGDIDLLVKQRDFNQAKVVILSLGYSISESDNHDDVDRHISLLKNGIIVELHWRFASENVIKNPEDFDTILFEDIVPDRTVLSDSVNGLVLLEHIAQHMNNGIGLRQIIDWMMYVHHRLNDTIWEQEFRPLAERTGLDKLAIHITRMCQMFIGLEGNRITWCQKADEDTCRKLMEYIIHCGNFGKARSNWESGEITKIPSLWHPIKLQRYLQKRGEINWQASRSSILKPFAWITQAAKYLKMIKRLKVQGISVKQLQTERIDRKQMFDSIGINIHNSI